MRKLIKMSAFFSLFLIVSGCYVDVQIANSPVIAKSSENVTFTATVLACDKSPCTVEILVNAASVKTCPGLSKGDTCTYTGGPYKAYEKTTVSYLANITDKKGNKNKRGYYYFGITDKDYKWDKDYIPARVVGSHDDKEDIAFHRASDYADFATFVSDVRNKIFEQYGKQEVIKEPYNMDKMNFYIYTKTAADRDHCGLVHADADTDMPWRDDDAVLHTADFRDCTSGDHFSAEGWTTKAFIHESGHAVFGLADEYDDSPGCGTTHFQAADLPNVWNNEGQCRDEQTSKGRDPDKCWEYTACSGGWWGIHQLADNTVMIRGNVGDSWGIESREHVIWYFTTLK